MNAREIVMRTVEFGYPERLAVTFPEPYGSDIMHASYDLASFQRNWRDVGGGWQEWVDGWGNTWARVDRTSKGEVVRGVLQSWDDLDSLRLPDLANPAYYARAREACADPANTRFRMGGLPGFPFDITRYMRRLEEYLADILWEPERVKALLLRVENLLADVIVQYGRVGVDGVMFGEDWGTQETLMIHPNKWREMFKPGFIRLCRVAHQCGLKVFMHSCGKITAIIPDLIEAGIDVLQFDQPRLHGLDTLARFHGQVTFWSPVDIQTTLQAKDEVAIEADAREMVQTMGGSDGGFIAGYYGDNPSIGLDAHWQDVACRAFIKYGDLCATAGQARNREP
jgi:uroporphyrinogen decarboxylase